jgi:hypothetical protein
LVMGATAGILLKLADLLGDWLAVLISGGDRTRILQLQDDIRAGMTRLQTVAAEARHERRTYLTQELDPDPLVRTTLRVRNDVIMIGRAAAEPLPEPIVTRLREPLEQVSEATQGFLRACAGALRERKNPPVLDAVEQALAKFNATLEELRREGATRTLPAENIGRLYALVFSLEQLHVNFEDFRNRVAESARAEREA